MIKALGLAMLTGASVFLLVIGSFALGQLYYGSDSGLRHFPFKKIFIIVTVFVFVVFLLAIWTQKT